MGNKTLFGLVMALLVVIAGYVRYLSWELRQHALLEAQQQQRDLKFDAAFLGTTPDKLAAQRQATGINAADDEADARAAGLK
jgi:Tfp pilus assembly protein PilO